MSNKDLLKQAIAEAKTIREAAIANAKEALEESLTPHLKEMLAAKLQEMENESEEEIVKEEDLQNNPQGTTAHGNIAEEEEEEEAPEGEEGEEDEDLDFEKMSKQEFTDLVLSIVAQDEEQGESEEEIPGEEAPEGDDMMGMDSEEEIDINELLAELSEINDDEKEMEEGIGSAIKGAAKKVGSAINRGLEKAADAGAPMARKIAEPGATTVKNVSEQELDEGFDEWLDGVSAKLKKFGKNNPALRAIEKAIDGASKAVVPQDYSSGEKAFQESVELEEALSTVSQLRTQLQEVNLLNAKLLYVNKVFKANNLTEGQKVNVVAAFDKAETVREVKLVFETVSKNVTAKPAAIKEHRSFASKAAGTAKTGGTKEVITEVSAQVLRMQKLAGIIK